MYLIKRVIIHFDKSDKGISIYPNVVVDDITDYYDNLKTVINFDRVYFTYEEQPKPITSQHT